MRHLSLSRLRLVLAVSVALCVSAPAWAKTFRSTRYLGATHLKLPETSSYLSNTQVIEGWVYRDDATRTESIVSNSKHHVYFQGQYLKYGWGTANKTVPSRKWTHVAVVLSVGNYKFARFYVNGDYAGYGMVPLAYTPPSTRYNTFLGHLDEVRVWNVYHTQDQIRADLNRQVREGTGLVGTYGNGFTLDGSLPVLSPALCAELMPCVPKTEASVLGVLPGDLDVPRAVFAQVDGVIDLAGEYKDAERIVLRFPGQAVPDGVAYAVHTDDAVYVGIPSTSVPESLLGTSFVGLMLDPSYARTSLAGSNHHIVRAWLDADPTHIEQQVGDGVGGWKNWSCTPPATTNWWDQLAYALCLVATPPRVDVVKDFVDGLDDVGPRPMSIELRVPKTLLGEWTELDGLALGIMGASQYLAPLGAAQMSPVTWATVRYNDTQPTLPRVNVSGRVLDSIGPSTSGPGLPSATVQLWSAGPEGWQFLYTTTTDASGNFAFTGVTVPSGADLLVKVPVCTLCKIARNPSSSSSNIQPYASDPGAIVSSLMYPGCTNLVNACQYAFGTYFMKAPPGAITLAAADPGAIVQRIQLRQNPDFFVGGDEMRLLGTNLHPWVEVYLYAYPFLDPMEVPYADLQVWGRKADVLGVNAAGTELTFQVPPTTDLSTGQYDVIVIDLWTRPGATRATVPIEVTQPSYPVLYGLGFDNFDDFMNWPLNQMLGAFYGAYGNNSYLCLGALGYCACRVPDPLYLLYYPVFAVVREFMTGNCSGMATAGMLFSHGDRSPNDYDGNVFYGAGFRYNLDPDSTGDDIFPSKPEPDYSWYLCSAATPANVTALVESGQSKILSSEYLEAVANDLGDGTGLGGSWLYAHWDLIQGDPIARAAEIEAMPWNYILCMLPESMGDLGHAHCVVPYGVEHFVGGTTEIRVWDNNYPRDTTRRVRVLDDNHYYYELGTAGDPSFELQGSRLLTIPYSVVQGSVHAPGLWTLAEWSWLLVFGSTGLVTSPSGQRHGTLADGTQVTEIPGVKPMPMPEGGNPARLPLLIPVSAGNPTLTLRTDGGQAGFHIANGGRVLQLISPRAAQGDVDTVEVRYDGAELAAFAYRPQRDNVDFRPRVGMRHGENVVATYTWAGLAARAGRTSTFALDSKVRGATYRNDSGVATRHSLLIHHVDGPNSVSQKQLFGPLSVPAGATQRAALRDWPAGRELTVELDTNGDGVYETSQVLGGLQCASPTKDCNQNGVDDTCDLADATSRDDNGDAVPDECAAVIR
jgi:hypothetical protein